MGATRAACLLLLPILLCHLKLVGAEVVQFSGRKTKVLPFGKYNYTEPGSKKVLICDKCPAGTFVFKHCTETEYRECSPCPNGTFTKHENGNDRCHPCRPPCEPHMDTENDCSTLSDRECSCPTGTYLLNGSCANHSLCPIGWGIRRNGSKTVDVKCRRCPHGAYSDVPSSTMSCKVHTNCSELGMVVIKPGTKEQDNVCGPLSSSPSTDLSSPPIEYEPTDVYNETEKNETKYLNMTADASVGHHQRSHGKNPQVTEGIQQSGVMQSKGEGPKNTIIKTTKRGPPRQASHHFDINEHLPWMIVLFLLLVLVIIVVCSVRKSSRTLKKGPKQDPSSIVEKAGFKKSSAITKNREKWIYYCNGHGIDILKMVAAQIGSQWQDIYQFLCNASEHEMAAFRNGYTADHERAYAALQHWTIRGPEASLAKLISALRQHRRNDVVEKIRGLMEDTVQSIEQDPTMTSKRPSGAEYRKRRKNARIEDNKMSSSIGKWLGKTRSVDENTEIPTGSGDVISSLSTELEINLDTNQQIGENTSRSPSLLSDNDDTHCTLNILNDTTTHASDEPVITLNTLNDTYTEVNICDSQCSTYPGIVNFNDPPSWPCITDNIRCHLIEHGPDQGKTADFRESASEDGRKFSKDWFFKKLSNGEVVERNWLIYSENRKSIFCFPCMLFDQRNTKPNISVPKVGFNDWKNVNRIVEHENSSNHRQSFCEWKSMEKRMFSGDCIDDSVQKAIESEKQKWRHILKVILDAIMFCAQNNLPLRGSSCNIKDPNSGIFLSLLELISHYDVQLNQHIAAHKKGLPSYFSPTIQNEFIGLLGDQVRGEIISRVKKAKYYSLLLDCTPDISHQEQMSQIVRYVRNENGVIAVEESFIDFIETKEKTGSGLAEEIIKKLEKDGLNLQDVRGQGYDNGANMSGVYKGVRAVILQKNKFANFVPCSAHCLNLVGVHAASINSNMVSFFATVNKIYQFFSQSTSRWDTLMSFLKLSLKSHADTRWSSKANAIRALGSQISEVAKALKQVALTKNPEAVLTANSLLKKINFDFLCTLCMWRNILSEIDRVNRSLQAKGTTVYQASKMIQGLKNTLQEMRDSDSDFVTVFMDCKKKAEEMGFAAEFIECRKRKIKRQQLYECEDESSLLSPQESFKIQMKNVFDTIVQHLTWRYEALNGISSDFEFLSGDSLLKMDTVSLQKAAVNLSKKYDHDINMAEISSEIQSFKHQAIALLPTVATASSLDLLHFIHDYNLAESYPNIEISIRIFLSLPVTVASCERSFSKLKLIKNYLRASTGQDRLTSMSILSIEQNIAKQINFDAVIDKFASLKARKVKL